MYMPVSFLFFTDIDECSGQLSLCDLNAKCINTVGDHECYCFEGYDGDGFNCTGIERSCQN